jgi:hypothetical protein
MFIICSENLVIKQFVSILALSTIQEIDTKQEEVHQVNVTSRISEDDMRLRGLVEELVVVGKEKSTIILFLCYMSCRNNR